MLWNALSAAQAAGVPTVSLFHGAYALFRRGPARVIATVGPAIDPASLPIAANIEIVRYVPHTRLFPHASLVVTHAGLGTVMTALAHGVPMLCMPLGRDQFFNAARVAALGVGRVVGAGAHSEAIATAVRTALADEDLRNETRRWPAIIAAYRQGADAIDALEQLASTPRVRVQQQTTRAGTRAADAAEPSH
jgi:UDP:flavonoid glycosyltransferase YjiC (YdhE family)